jgi:hypothetical protein
MNCSAHPPLTRGESLKVAAKEADLEVPVRRGPQKPLVDGNEASRLRDGVGGEVVKLHPVMMAQPPHEPARRGSETTFVQADEADNVAVRGVGLLVRRRRDHPRRI